MWPELTLLLTGRPSRADYIPRDASNKVYGALVSEWRKSPIVAGIVIGGFVIVQLAIPISRFGDDADLRRFSWQMFSSSVRAPEFVVHAGNDELEIDLEGYMARVRADVEIETIIPDHLCKTIPGAEFVTWDDMRHEC